MCDFDIHILMKTEDEINANCLCSERGDIIALKENF